MIQLNLMNMDFNTKYKEFKTAVEIVFQTSNFEVWWISKIRWGCSKKGSWHSYDLSVYT